MQLLCRRLAVELRELERTHKELVGNLRRIEQTAEEKRRAAEAAAADVAARVSHHERERQSVADKSSELRAKVAVAQQQRDAEFAKLATATSALAEVEVACAELRDLLAEFPDGFDADLANSAARTRADTIDAKRRVEEAAVATAAQVAAWDAEVVDIDVRVAETERLTEEMRLQVRGK